MAAKGATRTVSFFRLAVHDKDGNAQQFANQNWQGLLGQVAGLDLVQRTHTSKRSQRRLIGEVLTVDDDHALKLMEPRDENSWLEILKGTKGAEPVDEKTIGTLVETTIVVFLPDNNVFGIIRGSTASPTHTAVSEWLHALEINGNKILTNPDHWLVAEPALSRRAVAQLNRASGVGQASMKISTSQGTALEQAGSTLVGETLKRLKATYGDILVTVTLQIPRGKANDAARKTLKEETQRWNAPGVQPESITATLVNYDEEERAHQEKVNFIAQRITMQRGVPLHDSDGNPIRNDSAVRAIWSAAQDLAEDLKSIV